MFERAWVRRRESATLRRVSLACAAGLAILVVLVPLLRPEAELLARSAFFCIAVCLHGTFGSAPGARRAIAAILASVAWLAVSGAGLVLGGKRACYFFADIGLGDRMECMMVMGGDRNDSFGYLTASLAALQVAVMVYILARCAAYAWASPRR